MATSSTTSGPGRWHWPNASRAIDRAMPSWRLGARSLTVPHAPTRPPHAAREPRPAGRPPRTTRRALQGPRPDRGRRRRRSVPTTGPRDPDALLRHFGFGEFRPGQREAVQAALEGRDSLVVMPTGGGKSLCYQLPGIASADLTVIVSPLIALMADQYRRLLLGGHPAAMIASGMEESAVRGGAREHPRRQGAHRLLLAGALRLDVVHCPRSRRAPSTCSRSTRHTACRNGVTTSAPTTCGCAP